jgi:hypothetical protein
MGSPEKLFGAENVKALGKTEKAHLKKELKRLLKDSPVDGEIIKAHDKLGREHQRVNKKLKKKLLSTFKRLKAQSRRPK